MIDSHCHLNFNSLQADTTLLSDCQTMGFKRLVVPAVQAKDWQDLLTLSQQQSLVNIALGLHPLFVQKHQASELKDLERLLTQHPDITALGEIGLDFWHSDTDMKQQYFYFAAQLELACEFDKPVILHARKSHDVILKYLGKTPVPRAGIVHAFSGSQQQAERYLALGFKLGMGGAVTHPRATKLRQLLKSLPLESWVLETDAPDMAPAFLSAGSTNSPRYLPIIAQVQAHILELDYTEWVRQTTKNTMQILNLSLS